MYNNFINKSTLLGSTTYNPLGPSPTPFEVRNIVSFTPKGLGERGRVGTSQLCLTWDLGLVNNFFPFGDVREGKKFGVKKTASPFRPSPYTKFRQNQVTNDSRELLVKGVPVRGKDSLLPHTEKGVTDIKILNYNLDTYHRSNQDTCLIDKAVVKEGEWVQSGDLLADCASSVAGELSIGHNIVVAYMPWEGFNYEDAILINERLVYEDIYTSIHIERYETVTKETKLGPEQITRNIPDVSQEEICHLDKNGIAKIGSPVEEGSILVGKVTPFNTKAYTANEKFLFELFEKKLSPTKDSSLRAPKGIRAHVINVNILAKQKVQLLLPGMPGLPGNRNGVSIESQNKLKGSVTPNLLPVRATFYLEPKGFLVKGSGLSERSPDTRLVNNVLPRTPKELVMKKLVRKELRSVLTSPGRPDKLSLTWGTGMTGKLPPPLRVNGFRAGSTSKGVLAQQPGKGIKKTSKVEGKKGLKPCAPTMRGFNGVAVPLDPQRFLPGLFTSKRLGAQVKKNPGIPGYRNGVSIEGGVKKVTKSIWDVNPQEGKRISQKKMSGKVLRPSNVHIYLAEKRKVQVGDKLAGRHGNKGIVSRILPRQDMPFLPDGTPVDIVLNPLGVPSRMNVGQIYECLLGIAGRYLGEHYKIPPFDEIYGPEASRSFVFSKLFEARKKTGLEWLFDPNSPGKMRLFDGRTSDCFDQTVTVGIAYILKLVHMVDDKMHSRSTGPYSLVTQQPLRGRSKQGGQRLGEMEVWAIEGYGAAFVLSEMLTIKSDNMSGRQTLWVNLINNKDISLGTPESFKVLVCELQALCLDIGLFRQHNVNVDYSTDLNKDDSYQQSAIGPLNKGYISRETEQPHYSRKESLVQIDSLLHLA